MSKLYKELKYDTDRVMQPGDPLTSPNGGTSVEATDGGTATLTTKTLESCEVTLTIPEYPDYKFRCRFSNLSPTEPFARGSIIEIINGPAGATIDPNNSSYILVNGEYWGEIAQIIPWSSSVMSPEVRIPVTGEGLLQYGLAVNFWIRELSKLSSYCTVSDYVPYYSSGTSKTLATTDQIPNSFGTVAVGGSSVVADSVNDTLTISACSGVSVYANPSTDTINISLDTDTYNRIPPCGGYMEKVWANAGGAAEVASGCISIYGSSGVTTSASGGTLTISLDSNTCTKINGAVQGVALENAGGNLDLVDSNTKVATIPVMFRRVSFTSKTSSGQYCSGIIVPVNGEWDSDGSYNGTLEILACNGVIVYEYGSNGLEFDVAGDVPRTINTDGGSAYPSYNELNINGCNGISTSQLNNGNTIYVNLDAFFNTDSGSIGFSSGCVDIHGCNGISTTACNGAIVVSLDPVIATEYAEAAVKYSLLTNQLSLSTVSAPNDTAEATLVDHAINIVELPASVETVTFTFPAMIQGKARDFMIRLTIAGEVPTIYFQEPGGGSITFDADGETWTNIQPGANLIMFTETKQAQA